MASGGCNSALEPATLGPVDDTTMEASGGTDIAVESADTCRPEEEVVQQHNIVAVLPSTSGQPGEAPIQPSIPRAEFGAGVTDSNYQPQVITSIGELFQQDKLTDVMLMAEGQSIPCHKILLAGASEYFRTMFTSETNTLENQLLEIEDISFQTLKLIISYIYTGNIDVTADNAKDILPACRMLKLQSLFDTCEKHLIDIVNPQNCIRLHRVAGLHDIPNLKQKVQQVMLNNASDIVRSPDFKEMEEEELVKYIQDENQQVSDANVMFDGVVAWVKHDEDSRKCVFPDIMNHVRLQNCTRSHLQDVVSQEPLMQTFEGQKMLCAALLNQSQHGSPPSKKRKQEDHEATAAPTKGPYMKPTLLLMGGLGDDNCYHLENKQWKQIKDSQIANGIWGYAACLVNDGVLISGGYKNDTPTKECWLFSTPTYKWSPMPKLNTARARHGSTCVEGNVYVVGGKDSTSRSLSSVECLGNRGTWDMVFNLPIALSYPLVTSFNKNIYVLNEYDHNWQRRVILRDLYTTEWLELAQGSYQGQYGSLAVLDRNIYVLPENGSFQSFAPLVNRWKDLSRYPYKCANAAAVAWEGQILVCGGRNHTDNEDDIHAHCTSVIHEYDPLTDKWGVSDMKLPQKMSSHFVFVIGGIWHQGT